MFYFIFNTNTNYMKKIFIILLSFSFFLLSCKKDAPLSELDNYLLTNNINYDELVPYFEYSKFNYYDFLELEKLRKNNNYSHLEAINYFYNKNKTSALLANTDLVLINKQYKVDSSYDVELVNIDDYKLKVTKYGIQIQKHVLLNYINMINDLELHNLYIYSGYRSYNRQAEIYKNANDKNYVAKEGTSEHQSGLVLDVSTLTDGLTSSFQYSYEYQLISKYCMNYGFIIRYQESKESITGYFFEPWHLRYVGVVSAKAIMASSLTLEEYLFKNFEL